MRLKRYFLTQTDPCAAHLAQPVGVPWHALKLPSGGWVIVMTDGEGRVPPGWTELPHLLEQLPACLHDHGCSPNDTTYQAARKLAALNPHFHP